LQHREWDPPARRADELEYSGGDMKVTYDRSVNAAYIYIASAIEQGQVEKTYACDPAETGGQINLDFDVSGRLLGIEVLDASHKLPRELLEAAEIIG